MRRSKSDGRLYLLKCILLVGILITISLSGVMFGRLLRVQTSKGSMFFTDYETHNVGTLNDRNFTVTQLEQRQLLSRCNQKFVVSSYPKERKQESVINDHFCDCADGSDEFRTAACSSILVGIESFECYYGNKVAVTQLLRGNRAHKIDTGLKSITTSRVNDGVCDCANCSDEI